MWSWKGWGDSCLERSTFAKKKKNTEMNEHTLAMGFLKSNKPYKRIII